MLRLGRKGAGCCVPDAKSRPLPSFRPNGAALRLPHVPEESLFMKKFLIAAALVVVPVTAAHAMTVAVFLQKAEALKRRGPLALLSSDLGLLKTEVRTAAAQLKSEREGAVRAGRRPAFCPPANVSLNAEEVLNHMRSIPAAHRPRMEVRDALRMYMARRYPCR